MAWPTWAWRAVATGALVVAGVAVGVVTNVVTEDSSVPWVAGLGVLVVMLVAIRVWLTVSEDRRSGRRMGAGSAYVGGSSTAPIMTDLSGVRLVLGTSAGPGDVAGPGAVVVEGNSGGEIRTRVRDVEER